MNERSIFHLISEFTRRRNIAYVLIGGFAVNHYKVTRQTADVDFLITRRDFDKIHGFLEEAGYRQSAFQENFVQMKSSHASLMDVDFMFVDATTLDKILKRGERIKIAGETFVVPSLDHLVALKLHSIRHNPKIRWLNDFPDIVRLAKINKMDVGSKKFKEMCLEYGTEDIYFKILEALS